MASEITIDNTRPADLIARLQDLAPRLENEDDYDAKKEALQITKALTAQLEQPGNVAVDMIFSPMIAVTARTAIDLNLYEHILLEGPVTSARLAVLSGADELLIIRILRVLSAVHFVEEAAPRTWKATRITAAMAVKEIAAGHRMVSQMILPAVQTAPAFFAEQGYSCPTDPRDGLLQVAHNAKGSTVFEYMASRPSLLRDFNLFMGNTMGARKYWVDWYPVQTRILDGADPSGALIVDVGAGKGHDLVAFDEKFPGAGRLVLEDLAAVVEGLGVEDLDEKIERVAYDFFTEQPVKGARVYFYHHILHDWSDEYCLKILENVTAVMTPGYSKLLVHEMIVPEQGASLFEGLLDMTVMAFNAGMERTKQQWRVLLEAAGLQVVSFWDSIDEGGDGIIEAMKV
ncbi:o-methyltransferase [Aspergillus steynii IBT 23096]|uniref:O-methyltransferase n=1 Tax=Aspergillus steynii IBT 23096 TaxID=1392250 RepID=A0A2I2GFB7_9EURO|nr:o-methyltransferase [Aspergillus steynii IBT 23096]PLB51574.1 o-methyltransferase [Aspergillus steynii IBT 23096]